MRRGEPMQVVTVLSVERFLIWVYAVQRADAMAAASMAASAEMRLGWSRVSLDGVAACARNAALGGPIMGGGISSALHPDAEAADALVSRMRGGVGDMLRHFGRTGIKPECFADASIELRPILRPNGKPVRLYDNRGNYVGTRSAEFIRSGGRYFLGGAAILAGGRRAYGAWHAGMLELMGGLAGRLVAHKLTLPSSPAAPWEAGEPRAANSA